MQSYKKILEKLCCNRRTYTKNFFVCCLLSLSVLQTHAQGKKLQIEGKTFTIREIFNHIEQQTSYNLGYSSTLLNISHKVTLSDPKETLDQVLTQTLHGTGYTYRLDGIYIFIEKVVEEVITRNLRGSVFDDNTGRVIAGASIQVAGHPLLKARSNESGEFTIKEVPAGDHSIRVMADHYMPIDLGVSLNRTADLNMRVRLTDTRSKEEPLIYSDPSDMAITNQDQVAETIVQSFSDNITNGNNALNNNTTDNNIINHTISGDFKQTVTLETNILSQKAEKAPKSYHPLLAEKVNLLYLATTSLNIGAELALSDKWTIDATFGYNPWKFGDGKIKHWLVMPEVRYWLCQSFEGHFFGLHGLYSKFNVGNLSFISSLKEYSYQGRMYGGGISYGYHFPLKGKWGIELTAGVGYLRLDYDKYECHGCKEKVGSYKRNYFGPTKAGITLIYMLD